MTSNPVSIPWNTSGLGVPHQVDLSFFICQVGIMTAWCSRDGGDCRDHLQMHLQSGSDYDRPGCVISWRDQTYGSRGVHHEMLCDRTDEVSGNICKIAS